MGMGMRMVEQRKGLILKEISGRLFKDSSFFMLL
jgi:hypothetical protein